ncbi:MAG: AMP-binding protein, partial [Spirochaetota bacterium]
MELLNRLEPGHLVPLVRSLVVSHLGSRREIWSVKQEARAWDADTTLDERGVGLDSFDLLTLAGRVNTMFHLHEAGIEEYLLARRRPLDWGEIILHAWRNQKRPRVTFTTSGTTGTPRPITHELAALDEEISAFLDLLPPARRTLAYVPAHHIYGFLFTVMMPTRDSSEHVPAWLNPLGAPARPGDRIVAFPEMWRLIAAGPHLPQRVHGISSTAPLSADVAATIRSGGVRLVEIYGSTESAGVGYRTETNAPYRLLPHWKRTAAVKRGGTGADADQATNARPTVTSLEREIDGLPVRVELADRLEWRDHEHFLPAGRID